MISIQPEASKNHMIKAVVMALSLIGIAGCSGEVVHYPSVPALHAEERSGARWHTSAPIHVRLSTGYERAIPSGTEFIVFGKIPEGIILRPTSYVLTVEGAHVHEAYLVVDQNHIVGFYLPVEHAFSPLKERAAVDFARTE